MILLIVILFVTLIVNPTTGKSHGTCNDVCLTKTYCLSSGGSNVCSKKNLVTAKCSVEQYQGDDLIKVTLNGKGIKSNEEKLISLTLQTLPSSTVQVATNYTCFKSSLGATSAKVLSISSGSTIKTVQKGSSFYSNDELSCTWTFTKGDEIYPLFYDISIDLITDSDYQLVLQYGAETAGTIVATDTTKLPIYHLQYLKCCYRVHGNNNYLLITNQTTDNQYLVQELGVSSKMIYTSFKADKIQLLFICDLNNAFIQGSIINDTETKSISDQLYGIRVTDSLCRWSHPLTLTGFYGRYDTTNGVYDLQITADKVVVYSEKGVKLRNSASKLFTLSSIILTIISLLLNFTI